MTKKMHESLFAKALNNRQLYAQYINPQTGLFDIIQFARNNQIGTGSADWWQMPVIVFDPSWNTSDLYFQSSDLRDCDFSAVTFDRCLFNTAKFRNCNSMSIKNTRVTDALMFEAALDACHFENLTINNMVFSGPLRLTHFLNIKRNADKIRSSIELRFPERYQRVKGCTFENIFLDEISFQQPDFGSSATQCLFQNVSASIRLPTFFYWNIISDSKITVRDALLIKEFDGITIQRSSVRELNLQGLDHFPIGDPRFIDSRFNRLAISDRFVLNDFVVSNCEFTDSQFNRVTVCKDNELHRRCDADCNNVTSACVSGPALREYFQQQNANFSDTEISCYSLPCHSSLPVITPAPNNPAASAIAIPITLGVLGIVGLMALAVVLGIKGYQRYQISKRLAARLAKESDLTNALSQCDIDGLLQIEQLSSEVGIRLPLDVTKYILASRVGDNAHQYAQNYARSPHHSPAPSDFLQLAAGSPEAIERGDSAPFIRFCDSAARQKYRKKQISHTLSQIKTERQRRDQEILAQQEEASINPVVRASAIGLFSVSHAAADIALSSVDQEQEPLLVVQSQDSGDTIIEMGHRH
jgi:uncharacterized protein YjbI with pentapeptide repeats